MNNNIFPSPIHLDISSSSLAGPEVPSVEEMLAENERRRARLLVPYDPIRGDAADPCASRSASRDSTAARYGCRARCWSIRLPFRSCARAPWMPSSARSTIQNPPICSERRSAAGSYACASAMISRSGRQASSISRRKGRSRLPVCAQLSPASTRGYARKYAPRGEADPVGAAEGPSMGWQHVCTDLYGMAPAGPFRGS